MTHQVYKLWLLTSESTKHVHMKRKVWNFLLTRKKNRQTRKLDFVQRVASQSNEELWHSLLDSPRSQHDIDVITFSILFVLCVWCPRFRPGTNPFLYDSRSRLCMHCSFRYSKATALSISILTTLHVEAEAAERAVGVYI